MARKGSRQCMNPDPDVHIIINYILKRHKCACVNVFSTSFFFVAMAVAQGIGQFLTLANLFGIQSTGKFKMTLRGTSGGSLKDKILSQKIIRAKSDRPLN